MIIGLIIIYKDPTILELALVDPVLKSNLSSRVHTADVFCCPHAPGLHRHAVASITLFITNKIKTSHIKTMVPV